MKIAFVHYFRTSNQGDLASGPYNYLDLSGHEVSVHDILAKDFPRHADLVILGGGALGYAMVRRSVPDFIKARAYIAWGVGRSMKQWTPGHVPPMPGWLTVAGVRDYGGPVTNRQFYAPCVSCMHKGFDKYAGAKTEFKFAHLINTARKKQYDLSKFDVLLNNRMPVDMILDNMARSETIVTDSYHGALWGMWLKKRVIVWGPYSSKFQFFRHKPVLVPASDSWRKYLDKTRIYEHALDEARRDTRKFMEHIRPYAAFEALK